MVRVPHGPKIIDIKATALKRKLRKMEDVLLRVRGVLQAAQARNAKLRRNFNHAFVASPVDGLCARCELPEDDELHTGTNPQ